ncbi:MAG: hypothetical protein IT361_08635 [Gemmatimonadaceae bacterium]|nr:hypothetical protein [Gemmatimonadaceae bacterium]
MAGTRTFASVAHLVAAIVLTSPVCAAGAQAPATASASASAPPFFGVPWGLPVDSLRSRTAVLGWEFLQVDADGDYAFRARVDGEDAMVFATFGAGGLTRVLVSITPHPGALLTYENVADTLRHHFGPAALSTQDQHRPTPPAPAMLQANAWRGVLMGLRRDGRIMIVLTCPETSPRVPVRRGPAA